MIPAGVTVVGCLGSDSNRQSLLIPSNDGDAILTINLTTLLWAITALAALELAHDFYAGLGLTEIKNEGTGVNGSGYTLRT